MKTNRNHRNAIFLLFSLFVSTVLLQAFYIHKVLVNNSVADNFGTLLWVFFTGTVLSGLFLFRISYKAAKSGDEKDVKGVEKKNVITVNDSHEHEINRQIVDRFAEAEELVFVEIFKKLDDCTSLEQYGDMLLSNMAREFDLVQGLIFWQKDHENVYTFISKYAFYSENLPEDIHPGIGLSGQVAKDGKPLIVDDLPEKYGKIVSGLGSSKANFMGIFPIIFDEHVIGIVELASFVKWKEEQEKLLVKVLNRAAFEMNRFSN